MQPYSGSQANLAAYLALLKPGDTLLGMRPAHGGHRTHGANDNASGQIYDVAFYDVDARSGEIDYDQVASLAHAHRPKLIVAGFSAYSRVVDWARFRAIADDVGALFLADIAHVAGLIAAGLYPNPVPLADLVTTTTHKTLRGPRGGHAARALALEAHGARGRGRVPGHAGRAADARDRREGRRVRRSARARVHGVPEARRSRTRARIGGACSPTRGYTIVSGGTDNHMLLVDLRGKKIDAQRAERALEARTDRGEPRVAAGRDGSEPTQGSGGLRLGTPAVTTRGFGERRDSCARPAGSPTSSTRTAPTPRSRACARTVLELCAAFPVYGPIALEARAS